MDGPALQDIVYRGMGVAARKLGTSFVVYRPNGDPGNPVAPAHRVIRLYASFNAEDDRYRRPATYGHAVRWGIFDASYTKPGDYLVGELDTYFICSQPPALPVQCVKTNVIVDVIRAQAPSNGGYGGMLTETAVQVSTGWPASILEPGSRVPVGADETRFGTWTLLLPGTAPVVQVSDGITDDGGITYVVGAAERSELGWRVKIRQLAT